MTLPLLAPLAARGSAAPRIVALLIGGVLLVAFLLWYFDEARRMNRLLRSTPVARLADLLAGDRARVVGKARPEAEPIEAPLTGRPCVYYRVEVTERRGKRTRTVIREAKGVPFLFDDGSGLALVDPAQARVVLQMDAHSKTGAFTEADATQEEFLARHGQQSKGMIFHRTLRFRESALEVGELVAVLGTCERTRDARGRAVVRLEATPAGPLVVSDAAAVVADAPRDARARQGKTRS
jgi:hypothetical protein